MLTAGAEPPLGAGPPVSRGAEISLPPGALLALYTDGLVENRTRDLDDGIELLARELDAAGAFAADVPDRLVARMLPDGPDDDVAMLVAEVEDGYSGRSLVLEVPDSERAVQRVRERITSLLASWGVPASVIDDVELLASELTTNAIVYAQPADRGAAAAHRPPRRARGLRLGDVPATAHAADAGRRARPGAAAGRAARRPLGDAPDRDGQGGLGGAGARPGRRPGAGVGLTLSAAGLHRQH